MIRAVKRFLLLCVLLVPSFVRAQSASGPRIPPVPDAQRTDEQKAIAAEFAANEMANAVGTLLTYPSLARRIFPHDRYITTESTLMPRYRAILGLRTAWLARSNYLWAHRATLARRAGLTDRANLVRPPKEKRFLKSLRCFGICWNSPTNRICPAGNSLKAVEIRV